MADKYDDLKPLVAKYLSENEAVHTRRKLWSEEIKPLIQSTFQRFIEEFEIPLLGTGMDDALINHEAIYLGFDNEYTGIVDRMDNREMIKNGGGIVYVQNANGKVNCHIALPYIEGLKGEPNTRKEIGIFKPEDITEDVILSHIAEYFRETLQWECFWRQTIGYNHG